MYVRVLCFAVSWDRLSRQRQVRGSSRMIWLRQAAAAVALLVVDRKRLLIAGLGSEVCSSSCVVNASVLPIVVHRFPAHAVGVLDTYMVRAISLQ